jgi:hypothetical protein
LEANKTVLERVLVKIRSLHNRLNRVGGQYPPLGDDTVAMLRDLYAVENDGLPELVDQDLPAHWPSAS